MHSHVKFREFFFRNIIFNILQLSNPHCETNTFTCWERYNHDPDDFIRRSIILVCHDNSLPDIMSHYFVPGMI